MLAQAQGLKQANVSGKKNWRPFGVGSPISWGMFEQPLEDTFCEQEGQSPGGKGVAALAPTALSNTKPLSDHTRALWSNHLEAPPSWQTRCDCHRQLGSGHPGVPCRQSYLGSIQAAPVQVCALEQSTPAPLQGQPPRPSSPLVCAVFPPGPRGHPILSTLFPPNHPQQPPTLWAPVSRSVNHDARFFFFSLASSLCSKTRGSLTSPAAASRDEPGPVLLRHTLEGARAVVSKRAGAAREFGVIPTEELTALPE